MLKPDFALCTSNARRVPVKYHITPLQITVAQRSGALFVPNTSSTLRKKFLNASCKGAKVMSEKFLVRVFLELQDKSATSERMSPMMPTLVFGFFYIETEQSCDKKNDHVPALLVMQNVEVVESDFFGYECIATFCAFLFEDEAGVRKQEWLIANFGSGFDFTLFLQGLYKQQKFVPKMVLSGYKVISMKVRNKRFIDFYLFVPTPLANFPKIFGLKELGKVLFPHYLTSPETFAEPAIALHSPRGCKATTCCQIKHQVSQSLQQGMPKDEESTSLGGEETAIFSLLPGVFPPPCLLGKNSIKKDKKFEDFILWHSFCRKKFKVNSSI